MFEGSNQVNQNEIVKTVVSLVAFYSSQTAASGHSPALHSEPQTMTEEERGENGKEA